MGYEIDFLPVGDGERSGDAIACRFGNLYGHRSEQAVMIVDGGFENDGAALVRHVRSYYDTDVVDLVVSTHPDLDHVCGLRVVIDELNVKSLWMHRPWLHAASPWFRNGCVVEVRVRDRLRAALEQACALEGIAQRRHIPITEPFAGLTAFNGVLVLGPDQEYYESLLPGFLTAGATPGVTSLADLLFGRAARAVARQIEERFDIETLTDAGETSPQNNSGTILLVVPAPGHQLLLTADTGAPALSRAGDFAARLGIDLRTSLLTQVPHHGSRRNVGPTILDRLVGLRRPTELLGTSKCAYVSAAQNADEKHPSRRVTNAFRRRGAPVFATQGNLIRYHYNAPARNGWIALQPLPFYPLVEDIA